MMATLTAAWTSLRMGLRYQSDLEVPISHSIRYWLKCVNLAVCYRGFVVGRSLPAARKAGKAAFLCCAYDVVTDWRNFDSEAFQQFERILRGEAPAPFVDIAVRLYRQELENRLEDDGLSRGVDALSFVSGLIGSEKHIRQNADFKHVGMILQIVDDVLDFEEDINRKECNCLLSDKDELYLSMLADFDAKYFRTLLPEGFVLHKVIKKAQKKAGHLLSCELATFAKIHSVHNNPAE
jgi:hypothetical protein